MSAALVSRRQGGARFAIFKRMRRVCGQSGVLLLEALFAMVIVATAVGVLAHLAAMAVRANEAAITTTQATLLASGQIASVVGALAVGGSGVTMSPEDALNRNASGFYDFFDARGRPLGSPGEAPAAAALVRRWAIRPLPSAMADARLVQVVVTRWPQPAVGSDSPGFELVRLVSVAEVP